MRTKKILLIANLFPPAAAIGAKRPAKLAVRLSELGWQPYVLTMATECSGRLDRTWLREELAKIPVVRVRCGSLWYHSRSWRKKSGLVGLGAKVQRGFANLTKAFLRVDDLWPWVLRATDVGASIVRRENIDLIWVTVPRNSSMWLASRIARRTGTKYIVDFRDVPRPVSQGPEKRHLDWMFAQGSKIIANASAVSYVARPQADAIHTCFPPAKHVPMLFAPNWFDRISQAGGMRRKDSSPVLLHGGRLYGGRRKIDGVLKAVQRLRHDTGQDLRFVNYGPDEDRPYLTELVNRLGLHDMVDLRSPIGTSQFQAECIAADVLLLPVAEDQGSQDHTQTVPGKLYDYFAARKPVLVVAPEGCHAGSVVREVRRGLAAAPDDAFAIHRALRLLLSDNGRGELLDLTDAAVADYEASAVVTKIDDLLTNLVTDTERAHRQSNMARSDGRE